MLRTLRDRRTRLGPARTAERLLTAGGRGSDPEDLARLVAEIL